MRLLILNRDLKKEEGRSRAGIRGRITFQADRAFLQRPEKGTLALEGQQGARGRVRHVRAQTGVVDGLREHVGIKQCRTLDSEP